MIQSTNRSRERIVAYGQESCGKSKAFLDIARATGATCWIIDNDNSIDRLLETEYTDLKVREEYREGELDDTYTDPAGTLIVFHCEGWEQNTNAMEEVWERADRNDWICIDAGSALWEDVQNWFVETAYGEDRADWTMSFKKQALAAKKAKATASEGQFLDWGFIMPQYNRIGRWLARPPCHLYVCAEAKKVHDSDGDGVQLYNIVGGMRPAGQKRLGHQAQTVLMFKKRGTGSSTSYRISSVKDRGRELLAAEEWDDFADDYLVDVGGWTEKKTAPATKSKAKAKAKVTK